MRHKPSIPQCAEIIFDLCYLLSASALGLYFIWRANSTAAMLWGVMALVLAFGDAFHLLPRILAAYTGRRQSYARALGYGKLITSITMTLFYLLLWQIGLLLFGFASQDDSVLLYALAAIRIVLCLLPQNGWTSAHPSYNWAMYRNIPFVLQGGMLAVFYAVHAQEHSSLRHLWLAILLSFAFYLPVVLFADKKPKLGMLMLPKTCVYVWMLCMGLFLL